MNDKEIQESLKKEAIENLNLIKEKCVAKVINELEIGRLFYLNNAKGLYFHLGYKSVREFILSLDFDYIKISSYMNVYGKYIVKLGFTIEELKTITMQRLNEFSHYLYLLKTESDKKEFMNIIQPNYRDISKRDIKYAIMTKYEFKDLKEFKDKLKKVNKGDLLLRRRCQKKTEIMDLKKMLIELKSEPFIAKIRNKSKVNINQVRKVFDALIDYIEN